MGKRAQVIYIEYGYSHDFRLIAKDNIIDREYHRFFVKYYVSDYEKANQVYNRMISDRSRKLLNRHEVTVYFNFDFFDCYTIHIDEDIFSMSSDSRVSYNQYIGELSEYPIDTDYNYEIAFSDCRKCVQKAIADRIAFCESEDQEISGKGC